eukprot:6093696-Pleurochrysis_carterae.AAC.1
MATQLIMLLLPLLARAMVAMAPPARLAPLADLQLRRATDGADVNVETLLSEQRRALLVLGTYPAGNACTADSICRRMRSGLCFFD